MRTELFIGLDVGTQGARAVVCDAAGGLVAEASRPFAQRAPSPSPLPKGGGERSPSPFGGGEGGGADERASARPSAALQPGWHEQEPNDWWDAAVACLQAATARAIAAGHPRDALRHAAVTSTSGTVLLVDAAGEPLRPALMYSDARAATEAAACNAAAADLTERLGYRYAIASASLITGAGVSSALTQFFNGIRPRPRRQPAATPPPGP